MFSRLIKKHYHRFQCIHESKFKAHKTKLEQNKKEMMDKMKLEQNKKKMMDKIKSLDKNDIIILDASELVTTVNHEYELCHPKGFGHN